MRIHLGHLLRCQCHASPPPVPMPRLHFISFPSKPTLLPSTGLLPMLDPTCGSCILNHAEPPLHQYTHAPLAKCRRTDLVHLHKGPISRLPSTSLSTPPAAMYRRTQSIHLLKALIPPLPFTSTPTPPPSVHVPVHAFGASSRGAHTMPSFHRYTHAAPVVYLSAHSFGETTAGAPCHASL